MRVSNRMPKSRTLPYCLKAFWVGGLICCIGQAIQDLLDYFFILTQEQLSAGTAIIMVFLGAFFTGIGIYDKIGAYAGAGSVVPITGFANSVVAPAIEFRPEGLVMGVAAKMFNLAGPVLVYGIGSSIIAGLVALIFGG
ncbi:MAG: stage V sporulation protein AC [Clostridia bacterium]